MAGDTRTTESVAETRMLVGLVAGEVRVRRRLARLLDLAGLEVAGEGADVQSLIARLGACAPRAIVVAPHDGPSIATEIRALRRQLRDVPIVALIPTADEGECRRAISAGADGAVLDRDLDDALVATVRAAAAGQISFPEGLQGAADEPSLTPRERQVLGSVVTGRTNAQIADQLGLAESTVKSHLSSAFAKLGVASRAEAAALIRDQMNGPGLDAPAAKSEATE
ncbi:MAG: LuxR C-terminal-related transcriptional regulator [Solirubrobacterales bacterium]